MSVPLQPRRGDPDAAHQVMTSVDVVSNLLECFLPTDSKTAQAWLASLALVHSTWSQSVYLALRRHPIISSIPMLLSFQDSLWTKLDRLGCEREPQSNQSLYSRTSVPSACAVCSLVINLGESENDAHAHLGAPSRGPASDRLLRQLQLSKELYLDPGFFSSLRHLKSLHLSLAKLSFSTFSFLLGSLHASLAELGLHDVVFVGSPTTSAIFEAVFSLPRLKSLHLTGRLASSDCIGAVLSGRSESAHPNHQTFLRTLYLADSVLGPSADQIIDPQTLLTCWNGSQSYRSAEVRPEHLPDSSSSASMKCPTVIEIAHYKFFTNQPAWYDHHITHDLRLVANSLGIKFDVVGTVELNKRIRLG